MELLRKNEYTGIDELNFNKRTKCKYHRFGVAKP